MIKSFADKATAAIFSGELVRRLPHDIQGMVRRKLKLIDAVSKVDELQISPGNRLEMLSGNRAVTADTAMRLARLFGMSAQTWMNLQAQYDLEVAEIELGDKIDHEVMPLAA